MNKNFKEKKEEQKLIFRFIGFRSIKTVLAVFICLLLGNIRQVDPLNSIIAAIVCMKESAIMGFHAGFDRVIGTLVGGIYGYMCIIIARNLALYIYGIPYYIFISLMLIPVIYTTININTAESVSIAAIVFFIVTISHSTAGNITPLLFVVNRIIDTIIGISVSVIVNWAIA